MSASASSSATPRTAAKPATSQDRRKARQIRQIFQPFLPAAFDAKHGHAQISRSVTMGMFDFMKTVGKKLGFGDDDGDDAKAEVLKKELDANKLGTDKVDVAVKGDTVVLKGVVKDQSAFEKAVIAVGNTLGISKVEADELKVVAPEMSVKLDSVDMNELVAAATPAKAPVFYTVKKGDNLWKIAESQYGKGKGDKNPLIFEANKPMLKHPDKIYPGQVLRIPDLETA
jgi:LysM repeat protein